MSLVYRGRSLKDGVPVAVKIPDQQLLTSPGALRQFFHEGNSLVGLTHPNIVKVHACGQQDGLPYIVMQYVDGSPLTEEMKARDTLEINEVVRLLRPVALALDYIHAKNIVHRDVKPGNIRLTRAGVPILVDFGIVQTGDATVWDDGKPRGSVWYMSPEQASGQRASGRSDQYSLAVVAYEMLSGRVPFDGENQYAIVLQQRDTKPPIPETWSPSLKAVMEKVLEKDPNNRYSTCIEFIGALSRAGQEKSPGDNDVSNTERLTAADVSVTRRSAPATEASRQGRRTTPSVTASPAKPVPRELLEQLPSPATAPRGGLRPDASRPSLTNTATVSSRRVRSSGFVILLAVASGVVMLGGAVYWLPRLTIHTPTPHSETEPRKPPVIPTWVRLTASPNGTIPKGQQVTLTWSTNADQLELSSTDTRWRVEPGGALTVKPDKTVTYTITASGPGGTKTDSLEITVISPPHNPTPKPKAPSKRNPKNDTGKRV
jgi:serine/threonine-protein kinase